MKKKPTEDATPALFGADAVPPADNKIPGQPSSVPPVSGEARGTLSFSYSKFSMYTECPLKYKFKYLDKLKEEPKPYFAFGNSIHKALEFLHAVSSPPFPSIDEVCEAFKKEWGLKSWLEKGYRDQAAEQADFRKGLEMLKAYYAANKGSLKPPFLLEYSTDVEVEGLKVRIIADRIEYLGGGEVELIDYKTGKDVKRQPDQLYMYQKISELDPRLKEKIAERYGQKVGAVKVRQMLYYHVPTLKEYRFERAGDREIGVFWDRVLCASGNIRARKFEPNPGEFQCHFCDFKKLCPVHAESPKTQAPSAAQPAVSAQTDGGVAALRVSAAKVEELVDRYGHLKEEMEKLNAQLDAVAAELGCAHTGEGKAELSGKKYSLELSRGENWKFTDREAVIGVLNEFDLYQKALGLTLPKIVSMLDDPAVPEAAKNKLKRYGARSPRLEIKLKKEE